MVEKVWGTLNPAELLETEPEKADEIRRGYSLLHVCACRGESRRLNGEEDQRVSPLEAG